MRGRAVPAGLEQPQLHEALLAVDMEALEYFWVGVGQTNGAVELLIYFLNLAFIQRYLLSTLKLEQKYRKMGGTPLYQEISGLDM